MTETPDLKKDLDKKPTDSTAKDKVIEKNQKSQISTSGGLEDSDVKYSDSTNLESKSLEPNNSDPKILEHKNSETKISEPPKRKKALTPAEALKLLKTTKEASRKSKTILSKTKKDWNSFTKTNKLATDLKLATKSKNSFLENSDFLARTQQKKDGLAREARIKGMGKI